MMSSIHTMVKVILLIFGVLTFHPDPQFGSVSAYKLGGVGKARSFKYMYNPYTFMEDSIHPNWWKRGGPEPPRVEEDYKDFMELPVDPKGSMRSAQLGIEDICNPENYWRVGNKLCIPYICLDKITIQRGDCACLLPHIGCKTLE